MMITINLTGSYLNLKGEPVERTPQNHPYNYDEYVQWMKNYDEGKAHVVYSDRLWEWDSKKYNKCCREVFGNQGQFFSNRKPEDIERFLSLYFGKEVKLTAILQGCNAGNGYPYWVFLYEE